ncbi:MAG: VOC family protein [Bacteroidota bacterium]|nr:VOC family protein [Bacteroidota bacterium]
MKSYQLGGIQQIGIGVKDLKEAWRWYISMLGMDCRIFEDEAEANLMLPFTAGQPRKRHAVLAINLQSGGGFEVWQHKGTVPEEIKEEIKIGDLGILMCKIKVKNMDEAYSFFMRGNAALLCKPVIDPAGKKAGYMKDPFGNMFQFVEGNNWFLNENKVSGGTYGAVIGVTDIDRSRAVYSDILGYDEVVYDKTGNFNDFAGLPGGNKEFRRVLLRRSVPFSGYFSRMFGQSEIELVSSVGTAGKRIFRDRIWGDPGFIHLCFDIFGMDELKKYCASVGFPFAVDSKQSRSGNSFDMGEAAGHFAYIEDPDGVLIEFVETHKIPVLKKLGWYINLKKRNSYKPLPDWILKTLKYSRVKKI